MGDRTARQDTGEAPVDGASPNSCVRKNTGWMLHVFRTFERFSKPDLPEKTLRNKTSLLLRDLCSLCSMLSPLRLFRGLVLPLHARLPLTGFA